MANPRKGLLRYLFRAPVFIYRLHLGWLLGHRFLLLTHIGRRSGLRRQTVLEVMEYRKDVREAIVMSGFGHNSDWLRNIESVGNEEVTIAGESFRAMHRFLDDDEASSVVKNYERANRFMIPIVRRVLTGLLGWNYRGSEDDRRRLVRELPLVAFRPRS